MAVVGIDLGGTYVKVGIVESGEVLARRILPAESSRGLAARLPTIEKVVHEVAVETRRPLSDCVGLGLISTGLVDPAARTVRSSNAKFDDAVGFDFAGWSERSFGLRLELENDARAGLLGEWRHGAGRGFEDLVYLTLGTGLGSGVLLRGRPLRGLRGQAGNLGGHLTIQVGGEPCTCPGRGCVETVASTWALPALAGREPEFADSALAGEERLDYEAVFRHAAEGDEVALRLRAHALDAWAACAISMIHAFDPARVIVGGGILRSADVILPALQEQVDAFAWTGGDRVEVVRARHLDDAALLGAEVLFAGDVDFL